MEWQYQQTLLSSKVHRYEIRDNTSSLSFAEVAMLWQQSAAFRSFYNALLVASPFRAYFWEHPPLCKGTFDQPYEFVLVESRALEAVQADQQSFKSFFTTAEKVVSFPNLRGDAQLIVPTPESDQGYPHLAQFCRSAPESTIDQLWQKTGQLLNERMEEENRWLSTSGLGVHWLHLRWDRRPKYYTYNPYR